MTKYKHLKNIQNYFPDLRIASQIIACCFFILFFIVTTNSIATHLPAPMWQSQKICESSAVACGDIDGDGYSDLVFGTKNNESR